MLLGRQGYGRQVSRQPGRETSPQQLRPDPSLLSGQPGTNWATHKSILLAQIQVVPQDDWHVTWDKGRMSPSSWALTSPYIALDTLWVSQPACSKASKIVPQDV